MTTTITVIFLILLSEIWNVVGNIFFKKSVNDTEAGRMRGMAGHLSYFKSVLIKKYVWVGFGFQVLCVGTWIAALAQADLSFVFPLGSAQYLLILFGAHIFLGERIDRMKAAGTLLVMSGIILIALS